MLLSSQVTVGTSFASVKDCVMFIHVTFISLKSLYRRVLIVIGLLPESDRYRGVDMFIHPLVIVLAGRPHQVFIETALERE
mgnify:CR=1 FL=1